MPSSLFAETHGEILILKFQHESGYPRLELALLRQLGEAISQAMNDSLIRGVILTGSERAFAAGAEIAEIAQLTPIAAREFSVTGQRVMRMIESAPKPVIAAIRGYCYGGGLDLALACHIRIASEDARFAHPGGVLGILTGWGGTQRLPHTMRPAAHSLALEMFTAGRVLTAEEALAAGLVSAVVPASELLARAERFVLRLHSHLTQPASARE